MNYENEIWRDIIIVKRGKLFDYSGKYQVSNLGRVKSLNYNKTGIIKLLKIGKDKKGYTYVDLNKNGKREKFSVHRLVATAFLPNPDNKPEVNHKDENPSNNNVSNLEWCDRKYNLNYGTHNERMIKKQGTKIICIETKRVFNSINEAERLLKEFKVTRHGITKCCKGTQKTAGGYHWQYLDDYLREQRMQSDINNSMAA